MASGALLPYPDPDKLKVRWITSNTIMIDIIRLRHARQAMLEGAAVFWWENCDCVEGLLKIQLTNSLKYDLELKPMAES